MCLSIPSKVVSIDTQKNSAIVDTLGVEREVSLDLLSEPLEIDDFVLLHVGYAINKIDKEDALASIEVFKELIKQMDEEEKAEALG